jgi:glutathione-independent formaldehyde dehydrogenase
VRFHAPLLDVKLANLTNGIPVQEQIAMIGIPEVDCFVDCVGFEASGHGADAGKKSRLLF